MAVKTLPENYTRNIEIMRENLRRGMDAGQAVSVIRSWHNQFTKAGKLGETEKEFLNQCLALVEEKTFIRVSIM